MAETWALQGIGPGRAIPSLKQLMEDYERRLILAALGRNRGNQRRAAARVSRDVRRHTRRSRRDPALRRART